MKKPRASILLGTALASGLTAPAFTQPRPKALRGTISTVILQGAETPVRLAEVGERADLVYHGLPYVYGD